MAITFCCPTCNAAHQMPDETAGRRGRCKHCGTMMTIPAAEAVVATSAGHSGANGRRVAAASPAAIPLPNVRQEEYQQPREKSRWTGKRLAIATASVVMAILLVSLVWSGDSSTETKSVPREILDKRPAAVAQHQSNEPVKAEELQERREQVQPEPAIETTVAELVQIYQSRNELLGPTRFEGQRVRVTGAMVNGRKYLSDPNDHSAFISIKNYDGSLNHVHWGDVDELSIVVAGVCVEGNLDLHRIVTSKEDIDQQIQATIQKKKEAAAAEADQIEEDLQKGLEPTGTYEVVGVVENIREWQFKNVSMFTLTSDKFIRSGTKKYQYKDAGSLRVAVMPPDRSPFGPFVCLFRSRHRPLLEKLKVGDTVRVKGVVGRVKPPIFAQGAYGPSYLANCIIVESSNDGVDVRLPVLEELEKLTESQDDFASGMAAMILSPPAVGEHKVNKSIRDGLINVALTHYEVTVDKMILHFVVSNFDENSTREIAYHVGEYRAYAVDDNGRKVMCEPTAKELKQAGSAGYVKVPLAPGQSVSGTLTFPLMGAGARKFTLTFPGFGRYSGSWTIKDIPLK